MAAKIVMMASPLPPQITWDLPSMANELGAAQTDVTSATSELSRFYLQGSDGTTLPVFLAVSQFVSSGVSTVSNATNATPVAVTTTSAHGLVNGSTVTVSGVTGNTAANGTWVVTVTGTTTFTLNGSTGSGGYAGGGFVSAGGGNSVVQLRRVTDAAATAFQSDGKLMQALAGVIAKLTV